VHRAISSWKKIERDHITAAEARKFLTHVVRTECQKIGRLTLLRRFNSHVPADDLRHENAARAVWQHIASAGLNASEAPDSAEKHLTQGHLDLIRADLISACRLNVCFRQSGQPTMPSLR